jgi:hypothetical protein
MTRAAWIIHAAAVVVSQDGLTRLRLYTLGDGQEFVNVSDLSRNTTNQPEMQAGLLSDPDRRRRSGQATSPI